MKVYQIEITNDCNYTCSYCPRTKHMKRPIQKMSIKTLDKIIELLDYQNSIRIHHYGESLLEKDLCYTAIRKLKQSGKIGKVILNTNGSLLTRTITEELFFYGLDELIVSYHTQQSIIPLLEEGVIPDNLKSKITVIRIIDPEKIEQTRRQMLKLKELGYNIELKRLRDLGKIGTTDEKTLKKVECAFLIKQEWIIQSNGNIGTCCEVYDSNGLIGNVHNENVRHLRSVEFSMCKGCPGYSNDGPNESERIEL